jgi:uncharacterized membrane protein YdjX (TVP38/TMEM64 family)
MLKPRAPGSFWLAAAIVLCSAVASLLFIYRVPLWEMAGALFRFISDSRAVEAWVAGWGWGAPLVFMALQIMQVLLAPIPGEATGLIGGYLFGAGASFIYSTIGLTVGSLLNFSLGRYLGQHFVRRWVPQTYLERFDSLVRHQGVVALAAMFIMPGFPKDYLCLFLGVSTLPLPAFIALAGLGRMPGTLLLSIQGAALSQQMYGLLAAVLMLCLVLLALTYRYREKIQRWIEHFNHDGKD